MTQPHIEPANRKIAVLMTAYKNRAQAERLINHLSKDFDIYVHIDKKSPLNIKSSDNVFVFKKYKIYWGSFEMVKAMLFLFRQAYRRKYNRYILISENDLPLKTNQEIIHFFENNHIEYIEGDKMPVKRRPGSNAELERVTGYWARRFHHRKNKPLLNHLHFLIQYGFSTVAKFKPRPVDYDFYEGSTWMNLTHACLEKIFEYLDRDPRYISRFKWTSTPEEIFFQTLVMQLNGLEIMNENLRYINWIDGPEHPRVFRKNDYEQVMNSNKLFARKFDVDTDKEIIEMIYKRIENQ